MDAHSLAKCRKKGVGEPPPPLEGSLRPCRGFVHSALLSNFQVFIRPSVVSPNFVCTLLTENPGSQGLICPMQVRRDVEPNLSRSPDSLKSSSSLDDLSLEYGHHDWNDRFSVIHHSWQPSMCLFVVVWCKCECTTFGETPRQQERSEHEKCVTSTSSLTKKWI